MPSILILSTRTFHDAPRIIREIDAFKNDYTLHCIGQRKPKTSNIYYKNIYAQRTLRDRIINFLNYKLYHSNLIKNYTPRFSKVINYVLQYNINCVIIHEPEFLPLAVYLKKTTGVKIVFNANEYHPLEFEHVPNWMATKGNVYYTLYKNYLHKVDLLINVCNGIAQKCEDEFGVKSIVIPNAAAYDPILMHNSVSNAPIQLIHHGAILPSRKIENMIEVAKLLGNSYTLTIMGMVNSYNEEYVKQLKKIAYGTTNVKFIPAVEFEQIIPTINKYDIGVYCLTPSSFNDAHSLPNKLFEFIQAKLAIAISPSIEMKAIVEQYNLGVVATDFTPESLAMAIKQLSKEDVLNYKKNAAQAATIENAEKYNTLYLQQMIALLN